jgi:type I restriction enzyme M protein
MPRTHRQRLGQFFTPLPVVDFALEALAWLDPGTPRRRRVMDPACGDGIFLLRAIERGLVPAGNAFGLDRDESLQDAWSASGMVTTLLPAVAVGDGLLDQELGGLSPLTGAFDWVVGNPPYAGEGLKALDDRAVRHLFDRYELMRGRHRGPDPSPDQLRRLPIEVMFAERFFELSRPGGHVAMVLPVGIFANERWRYVREWLLQRATVHAVVGLPRAAFGGGSITAKTCLLIARNAPAGPRHRVLLAEAGSIGLQGTANDLPGILRLWREGGEAAQPESSWALT